MSPQIIQNITCAWIALAILIYIVLRFVKAPFGRHTSESWGPGVNNKWGWFIMELPSFLLMLFFLIVGTHSREGYTWILFLLWLLHYFNRTFVYPIRIRPTPKKMPLLIVVNAIFFNLMNAGLNGYYLAECTSSDSYDIRWLCSPIFLLGICIFCLGFFINVKSDHILINLRGKGETGYKIPKGFLFEWISSPNLFGEMVEWSGFAIMAWNLPALSFMIWTFANLLPRAKNHHDWLHQHFDDYPSERKIIFPGIY